MLHTLIKLKTPSKKRLGRGVGSGKGGHYSTRGGKGHTARQGGDQALWFEGGQLPLIKRLPYLRGKGHFQNVGRRPQIVSLAKLAKISGDVTPETLELAGLIKNAHHPVKSVGTAQVQNLKEVRGVALTAGAKKALEAAGVTIA